MATTTITANATTRRPAEITKASYAPLAVLALAQIGTSSDSAAMNLATASLVGTLGRHPRRYPDGHHAVLAHRRCVHDSRRARRRDHRPAPRTGHGAVPGRCWRDGGGALPQHLRLHLGRTRHHGTWRLPYHALGARAGRGALPRAAAGHRVRHHRRSGRALDTLPADLGHRHGLFGIPPHLRHHGHLFRARAVLHAARPRTPSPGNHSHFDVAGTIVAALGMGLALFGVAHLSDWGIVNPQKLCPFTLCGLPPTLPAILIGLVLLGLLVPTERRAQRRGNPLIPAAFVTSPKVRAGLSAVALPFFYMGAVGILATPYLQLVTGFTALQTGMLSLLSGIPMFLLATFLPKLAPHLSSRLIIRTGFIAIACACALMAFGVHAHGVTGALFAGMALGGFGVGAVNSQSNNAVACAVTRKEAEQSGGIQGAARSIGLALGTALAGTFLLLTMAGGFAAQAASAGIDQSYVAPAAETASTLMSDSAFSDEAENLGGRRRAGRQARGREGLCAGRRHAPFLWRSRPPYGSRPSHHSPPRGNRRAARRARQGEGETIPLRPLLAGAIERSRIRPAGMLVPASRHCLRPWETSKANEKGARRLPSAM